MSTKERKEIALLISILVPILIFAFPIIIWLARFVLWLCNKSVEGADKIFGPI